MPRLLCAMALGLCLAAAPATWAGDPGAAFARLDKNGDGSLSREEYRARGKGDAEKEKKLAARFGRLDKNGDGKLTLAEYQAAGGKGGKKKEKSNAG